MECGHAAASDVARRRALQHRGRPEAPESTIGGQATPCIVCFVNPKSHAAVPCGHWCGVQSSEFIRAYWCACVDCSAQMPSLPRGPVQMWMCMYVRRDDFERERVLHATRLDVVIRSLL